MAHAYPIGDWVGTYEYGGRRLVLAATLTGPTCMLRQGGEETECVVASPGRGIEIRSRAQGEVLFTLSRNRLRGRISLITHWRGMRPEGVTDATVRGAYFHKQASSARVLGLFGDFRYIAQQDDCVGRLVWLRLRGATLEGEIAPYEGACETVKAAIVRSAYNPKSGALSFVTEPWLGDAKDPVGWRFEGRLQGGVLSGRLEQVVPATGESRSATPETARFTRFARPPKVLSEFPP